MGILQETSRLANAGGLTGSDAIQGHKMMVHALESLEIVGCNFYSKMSRVANFLCSIESPCTTFIM
jgi:hypothetical protein